MSSRPPVPRLHVLTDVRPVDEVLSFVATVLAAGAPCVQVRAKGLDDRTWYELAAAVSTRCREAGARCIVNDRADIARAAGADGVHVGDDDLPVAAARRAAGPDLLLGATARGPTQALRAVADGADYLGVGPVFATTSKQGLPDPIGTEGLAAVTSAVDVPVIGIAGVTASRVGEVLGAGAHGVAVVGAVSAAGDPAHAVRELLGRLHQGGRTSA